jgi:leucyl aminopeptidase
MRIRVESKLTGDFDALVVGVFSDDTAGLSSLDEKARALVEKLKENGFTAKALETDSTLFEGGSAKRLMLVGAGKLADYDLQVVRRIAGTGARQLRKKGLKKLAFALPSGNLEARAVAQAAAEGIVLSVFDAGVYRTGDNKEDKVLEDVVYISDGGDAIKDAVARGAVMGEGINFSRSLAHEPPNKIYPESLAHEAEKMSKEYGLDFHALDMKQLQEGGFNAIVAVGQGSTREPRMIVMKYKGAGDDAPWFGLVGKGITFDTGGLSLKPADAMVGMKGDMSGAAWVIGTMRILAQLKPKVNVIGIASAAENMPSSNAYRPEDVISTLEGKTIEVLNTDAEGRIVLADGLTYARKLGATKLVDLATLTGAIGVALGNAATGLFTSDEAFGQKFIGTAKAAGERAWHMPILPEHREAITSTIADIANTGNSRLGGASTAAAFLKEFTGGVPWIHLDIASTSANDSEKPYASKGANGNIMRSLVDFVIAHAEE